MLARRDKWIAGVALAAATTAFLRALLREDSAGPAAIALGIVAFVVWLRASPRPATRIRALGVLGAGPLAVLAVVWVLRVIVPPSEDFLSLASVVREAAYGSVAFAPAAASLSCTLASVLGTCGQKKTMRSTTSWQRVPLLIWGLCVSHQALFYFTGASYSHLSAEAVLDIFASATWVFAGSLVFTVVLLLPSFPHGSRHASLRSLWPVWLAVFFVALDWGLFLALMHKLLIPVQPGA